MSLSTPSDRNLPPESDHPTIFLPDASFLLYGEMERVGFDLVITNPAGEKFVVEDYFALQPPPTLMIAGGAGLTPEMVMALMPDQFADVQFAGPATSGGVLEEIGTVRFARGDVEVTDRNGDIRTVGRGDPIYKGDRIETGDRSFIRVRMVDGTRFNLGKNAEATLDDFEYDEPAGTGKFEAMVRVGGFHYKSGEIGKLNPNVRHSTIKTPSAFIGIRGSELEGTVDPSGQTIVVHRSGVLEITDINGENPVELTQPGNTSVVVFDGSPTFSIQPAPEQIQALQADLPPPDPTEDEVEDEPEEEPEETEEEVTGEEATQEEVDEAAEEEVSEEAVEEETTDEESEDAEEGGDEAEEGADETETDTGDETGSEAETGSDEPATTDTAGDSTADTTTETPTGDDVLSQQPSEAELSDATIIESGTADASGTTDSTGTGSSTDETTGDTTTTEPVVTETTTEPEPEPEPEPELPPDNPPIANPDAAEVLAGESIDLTTVVLDNDEDPDANQEPTLYGIVSNGVLGTASLVNGVLTYTADGAALLGEGETAVDTFTYQIASGNLLDSAQVQVTVTGINDAPVAVSDAATTDENTPITGDVLLNDVDPDASDTLSVVAIDTTNTVGLVTDNGDGTYSYDPNGQFDALSTGGSATDSFTYTVSDASGVTSTATVVVTIAGANELPLAVGESISTDENTTIATGNVLANDSDPDGDPLSVQALDTTSTTGLVTNNGDGTFSYNPNGQFAFLGAGETATDNFAYTISDGAGGTATATVSVTINGVNNAPVAVNDGATTAENTVIVTGNVLLNDTDTDGSDVLSVSAVDTTGTLGLVTNNGDGSFIYDPNGQFASLGTGVSATDSFVYTVTDGNGGTATATVTVTVGGTNDAPVATADVASANEDLTTVTGNVLANDTDLDGDSLTVLSFDTTGTLGLVTNNGDGTFTYNPNGQFESLAAGATAIDSFSYVVSDGSGGTASTSVTITVNGANDVPVATGDSYTAVAGQTSTLSVLLNDSDLDGDTLTVSTSALSELAGSLIANPDGTITYTPNPLFVELEPGETKTDAFVYTITDPSGAAATATVAVSVGLDPAFPQAAEDFYPATPLTAFVTGNVLTNDTGGSGTLTIQDYDQQTSNGSQVFYNGDGTFTVYLAPQFFFDFDGQGYLEEGPREEYFDYVVVDGAGQTDDTEVIIDVAGLGTLSRTDWTTTTTTTITDPNQLFVNDAWLTVTGASSIQGFLANLDQLEIATGATLTVDGGIGNVGSMRVNGTLTLTQGLFGSGWLGGGGTVDVSTAGFLGMGGISPGASIGTLTIIGNADPNTVQLQSHSHLDIEISSDGTDLLSITGAADLDGNVTVRDFGDAFPIAGSSYNILTTTLGYTGEFRNFELPVINGLVIDPIQNGTTVSLFFDYPTSSGTGTITPTVTTGEAILGSTGSDTFDLSANAAGDKFYGDLGTDVFIISDLGFARIDGGGNGDVDYDAIKFTTASFDLRGVTAYQIDSIDVVDVQDGSPGTLTLDVDSALNISTVLFIPADVGDHVILFADEGWAGGKPNIQENPFGEMFAISGQNADGDMVDLLISPDATAQIIESDGFTIYLGSNGNDAITGSAADEEIIGRAGDDQILAGAGDDEIVYDPDDVTLVDGGDGFDILIPTRERGAAIDLTTNNPYTNFESIDLGEGWDSNTLIMDLADVAQTGQPNLIFGDGTNQLLVEGTIDDYLILNGVNLRTGLPGGVTSSIDPRFPEYTAITDGTNTVLVENELLGPGINHAPYANPDSATTTNTVPIVLAPLANDLDPDPGDTITLNSIPASTSNGVPLISNGDGTFDYDPTGYFGFLGPGDTASDYFEYTIVDSFGVTSTGYVDIRINADPNALIAASDTGSTDEGTLLVTVDVLANDQNATTIVGFDRESWWGADVKYNGDNTFTYDPDHQFDYLATGQTATDGFSYTVTDGLGNTSTAFVDLTINGSSTYPTTFTNTSTTTVTTVNDVSDLYINDESIALSTTGNAITGSLENNFALTLGSGADLTVGHGVDNWGWITLEGGSTLNVQEGDLDNFGTIDGIGNGTVGVINLSATTPAQPVLESEGVIDPAGVDYGTLHINGGVELQPYNTLYIDMTQTGTATLDLLSASGNIDLGGELVVTPAVTPTGAETYTIVSAGSLSGEFHRVAGLDQLGDTVVLDVQVVTSTTTTDVLMLVPLTANVGTAAAAPGQAVVGTSSSEVFDLTVNASGSTYYSRAGNDVFQANDFSFRRIDGGGGIDILEVPGGDLGQLTSHYQLDGIELIDLTDGTPALQSFDQQALSYASDFGGVALLGDAGDEHNVTVDNVWWENGSGPSFTEGGIEFFTYYIYTDDGEDIEVNVSTGVRSIVESSYETLWYGSTATDTFTDTTGDRNIFVGHGGDDSANLGLGYDEIVYDPSDVTPGNIDGGGDEDTLQPNFDGPIDLTVNNPYVSVERIDLQYDGPNAVLLNMADVAQMGTVDQYVPDGSTQVMVTGDSDDRVALEGVIVHSVNLSTLTGLGLTVDTIPVNIFGDNFITITDGTNTLFVSENIYLGEGNVPPETTSTVQAVSAAYTTADTFTVDLLSTAFDGNRDDLTVQGLSVVSGDASGITNNGDGTLTVFPNTPAYVNATTTTVTYGYTVADGFGGTTSGTATITLGGFVNQFVSGTSYNTAINWSSGLVPSSTDTVLIDTTGVTASSFAEAGLLELDDNAALDVGFTGTSTTNTFTVGDLVMGPGSNIGINGSNSVLNVTGNARLDGTSSFTRSGLSGFTNSTVEFSGTGSNINLPDGYVIDGVPWVLNNADPGVSLDITGGYLDIGSTGELRHVNGKVVVNTNGFSNSGTLQIAPDASFGGPWLHVHGDMDNYGLISLDNAVISSTGTESVTLDIFGGTLFNSGTITSADAQGSGGTRTLMGDVDNYNTIDVQYSLTIDTAGGDLYNSFSGIINVGAFQTLTVAGSGTFTNDGTINMNATNPTDGGITILDVSAVDFTNYGLLQGFGPIVGTWTNSGTNNLGMSPGYMEIHGDYNNTDEATLEIELEGYKPGTGYDQVIVHGTANLNGRLNVSLLNGFVPALAAGFVVLTADTLTGSFASAEGLDISSSQVLDLGYVDNSVELVTVAVTEAGTDGGDLVNGTSGADVVVAGGGDDVIGNVGNGDIVYGQAGNDTIEASGDFKRVDGGDGVDTLALTETVDLGNMQAVAIDNIEVIDLDNVQQDTLALDADAIKGMVDGHNELAGMDNALVVIGETGDMIRLNGDFIEAGQMSLEIEGTEMAFRLFTEGDVSLLVSDALSLEIYRSDGSVETIAAVSDNTVLTDSIDLSGLESLSANSATNDTSNELTMTELLDDGSNSLDGLLGSNTTSSDESGWVEPYAGPPAGGDSLENLAPMNSYSFEV